MGLHVYLELTCFCAGVVALCANESLLSTVNQLFPSVCECVPFEMFSLSVRIVTLLTPRRLLSWIIDSPWRHQHSITWPPFPSNHHIVIVLQCLMISWEKLFIDKIIQPKSNESMWYFRPLEILEGFSPVCLSLWFLSSLAERLISWMMSMCVVRLPAREQE